MSYTSKQHEELTRHSLLRRGLFRAVVAAGLGPGEREKRQRAGNAGKGKERREASAIFHAVGWSDLRFGGYGWTRG